MEYAIDDTIILEPDLKDPTLREYALEVCWWDSGVILGPVHGNPGGSINVLAKGKDFAETVAKTIRFVESLGHIVVQITTIP